MHLIGLFSEGTSTGTRDVYGNRAVMEKNYIVTLAKKVPYRANSLPITVDSGIGRNNSETKEYLGNKIVAYDDDLVNRNFIRSKLEQINAI